jgi:cytochrome oxidase assembly protein ShyY1
VRGCGTRDDTQAGPPVPVAVALTGVYRFLLTARWLGFAALMLALSAAMVGLGIWQLSRYHERSSANARIDAAQQTTPVPVGQAMPVGAAPPPGAAWTRVRAVGRYDTGHQMLARDRTVEGAVGYEVLTPLVLRDGSAVLVDRGWLPPGPGGAVPVVPAPPDGQAEAIGRVHLPESRPDEPRTIGGQVQVRRIAPDRLAGLLPYPVAGGYLLLDEPRDLTFTLIPSDHENAAMNLGYVVQWWAFALLTLIGFGWVAHREAHGSDRFDLAELYTDHPDAPVSPAI